MGLSREEERVLQIFLKDATCWKSINDIWGVLKRGNPLGIRKRALPALLVTLVGKSGLIKSPYGEEYRASPYIGTMFPPPPEFRGLPADLRVSVGRWDRSNALVVHSAKKYD